MSATAFSEQEKAVSPSESINEFFHEAMLNYEKALKSGIELQEESVKQWKELLTNLGSPEEFQAKLQSLNAEAFPAARKRMESFIEAFSRTSDQTVELFQKSISCVPACSISDSQSRVRDLIESSLAAMRVNVHAAINTNAQIMTSWKELVERLSPSAK
jgi:hypothetical protein